MSVAAFVRLPTLTHREASLRLGRFVAHILRVVNTVKKCYRMFWVLSGPRAKTGADLFTAHSLPLPP